jgi:hypothetical protein
MENPEQPSQDTYVHGLDVVRIIANEFGMSPPSVRSQINHRNTIIEIDDIVYTGDRFFIPVNKAAGKWVTILGPEFQWRMKFPNPAE